MKKNLAKMAIASMLLLTMLISTIGVSHVSAQTTKAIVKSEQTTNYLEVEFRVTITASVSEIAEYFAHRIEETGIKVVIEAVDFNTLLRKLDEGTFQSAFFGYSLTLYPLILASFRSYDLDNILLWRWENSTYDTYIENMLAAPNLSVAQYWAKQAQWIFVDELPMVPIYENYLFYVYNNETVGGAITQPGDGIDNYWHYINMTSSKADNSLIGTLGYYPNSLNPLATASAYSVRIMGLVWDSFYGWYFNGTDWEMRMMLGDSYETKIVYDPSLDQDVLVINATLKSGLKWSDGQPLTAEDFKFTHELINFTQSPVYYSSLAYWINTTVLDDTHFVIYSKQTGVFEPLILLGIPPLPKHIWGDPTTYNPSYTSWDNVTAADVLSFEPADNLDKMVGSGPFNVTQADLTAGTFTLEPNPYYWNKPGEATALPDINGPHVSKLVFLTYTDESAEASAFISGDIDMINDFVRSSTVENILANVPSVTTVVRTPRRGMGHVSFNTRVFPANLKAFRKAMAFAMDKWRVVNDYWGGEGIPIDSPVPVQAYGESWSIENEMPIHYYDVDITRANETLEAAGFKDYDGDGWREYAPPTQAPEEDTIPPAVTELFWSPVYAVYGENLTVMTEVFDNVEVDTVEIWWTYEEVVTPSTTWYKVPATYDSSTGQWKAILPVGLVNKSDLPIRDWNIYYIWIMVVANDTRGNVGKGSTMLINIYNDTDTDYDGMPDGWEYWFMVGLTYFVYGYYLDPENWLDADYDWDLWWSGDAHHDPFSLGDGLTNYEEFIYGTDPWTPDSDSDGIPDGVEVVNGLNPLDSRDALGDLDNDGVTNLDEYILGTDMKNDDTDGDGLTDYEEIAVYFTDPLAYDSDGDGYSDGLEVQLNSDPSDAQDTPSITEYIKEIESITQYDNGTIVITFTNGTTITVEPQTVTETVTDWGTTGIVAGVEAIVFIAIIALLLRRK